MSLIFRTSFIHGILLHITDFGTKKRFVILYTCSFGLTPTKFRKKLLKNDGNLILGLRNCVGWGRMEKSEWNS